MTPIKAIRAFSFHRLTFWLNICYLPPSNNLYRYERRELQRCSIWHIPVNLICLATELRFFKQHHLHREKKDNVKKIKK